MTDALSLDPRRDRLRETLLLTCVRAHPDADGIQAVLGHPRFDWASFWAMAMSQHVEPLVARVLSDARLSASLPAEARGAIKTTRLQATINNMAIHAELEAIGAHLHTHGVPVVPLKGTHLAQRVFGSLDARRCGDIDILVPEDAWETAHRLLGKAGYQPVANVKPGVGQHAFHDVPLVRTSNGRAFVVELHRQLSDPRFVTIDYCGLWHRTMQSANRQDNLWPMTSEEFLVFLAIHASKHDTGVLRLIADIDHLIAAEGDWINWHDVITIARAWHADTILFFVLTLTLSLLSTPVPEAVLRQLQPAWWKRRVVPYLVGPRAIIEPPMPLHLRANRFRIAYCLMLRHDTRELRSYWHYIMMPPRTVPKGQLAGLLLSSRRPLDGIIWTALAVGSAARDRVRLGRSTHL